MIPNVHVPPPRPRASSVISDSAGQYFARDQLEVTAKAAPLPARSLAHRDQIHRSQTPRSHRESRTRERRRRDSRSRSRAEGSRRRELLSSALPPHQPTLPPVLAPPPVRPPVTARFNAFPDGTFNRKRQDILDHLSSQHYSDKTSSTAFLEYLATLLARADLRSTDLGSLRQVEYDPSYYGQPGQEKIRFYILSIPSLKSRAGHGDDIPPEVRRAAPDRAVSEIAHVAFAHATARSNFVQILEEGKLAASKLHSPDSDSFFCPSIKVVILWLWQRWNSTYCTYGLECHKERSSRIAVWNSMGYSWNGPSGRTGPMYRAHKRPSRWRCPSQAWTKCGSLRPVLIFWKLLYGGLMLNNRPWCFWSFSPLLSPV